MKTELTIKQRKKIYMMSYDSHKKGKTFVSIETIIRLLESSNMICRGCGNQMVWTSAENPRRVMSLQHNRNATIELVCRSCNARHDDCPGDSYYSLDPNLQFCQRCRKWKTLGNFGTKVNKINKAESYCYQCASAYTNAWNKQHRETINTRRRLSRIAKNNCILIYEN